MRFFDFYEDVLKKKRFYIPFLMLSMFAYLPSLTNTKMHFEDFHRGWYLFEDKVMLNGRWGLWLWGYLFENDILNKFLGFVFVVTAGIFISAIFYATSLDRDNVIKYTAVASIVTTFPLINEIWSYNGANSIVCFNMMLVSGMLFFYLSSEKKVVTRVLLMSLPFIFVTSSYESAAFAYVTLVCSVQFYQLVKRNKTVKNCFIDGLLCAAPLAIGFTVGSVIGHIIAAIRGKEYYRHGATGMEWEEGGVGAFRYMIEQNKERYLYRGLVYLPIFIFDVCLLIFVLMTLYYIWKRGWFVILASLLVFLSVFLMSIIQCKYMPYRTAQVITVFVAFVVCLVMDSAYGLGPVIRTVSCIAAAVACFACSINLETINLTDYQNARNDEDLVRQIGFKLKSEYGGKPVLFWGPNLVRGDIYSDFLMDRVYVDEASLNGKLYLKLNDRHKILETNINSTLFLLSAEYKFMGGYFSYCGYPDIEVLDNSNIVEDYPEAYELFENGHVSSLQFTDMGDYVFISL